MRYSARRGRREGKGVKEKGGKVLIYGPECPIITMLLLALADDMFYEAPPSLFWMLRCCSM